MPNLTPITEELLKPTATIHVGNKLSLIERKVFNALIWNAQKRHGGKGEGTLPMALLFEVTGLGKSRNVEVMKEALEALVTTPIVWNTLKKDRTSDWGICTFLSGAELSGGRLRYVLNPLLVEKVHNPTLFAKIQLLVQTQFSSKYTIALYEYLIDELGRSGGREPHEFETTLDTLRHILQFDGAYKHLNNDVLAPCVRELNERTDIRVGYRGVKNGRAVVAVRFAIERSSIQIRMPFDGVHHGDEELPEGILGDLIERGVGERKARELVATYDEERVRENIAHVDREHAAGKVQKLSAFLISAIEHDYRPKKSPEERQREADAERERVRAEANLAERELRSAFAAYRAERTRERFEALPQKEQDARRHAFEERLRTEEPFLHTLYRKGGLKSQMVKARFYELLAEELLTAPEETSFDAFRVRAGDEVRK